MAEGTSTFAWTGGTIGSYMTVSIGLNVNATISGTGAKELDGTLDNFGSVAWTGSDIASGISSSIINEANAVFDIQAAVNLTGPSENITNKGMFKKSGGTAGSTLGTGIVNTGTITLSAGTLTVYTVQQTSGSTSLQGGNLTVESGIFELDGGILSGNGTVTGDVYNTGEAAASTVQAGVVWVGQLNIIGNYTQSNSNNATIQLYVSATGTVNVLNVEADDVFGKGGTATINGGRVLIGRDDAYKPAQGTLTFLKSVVETGVFSSTNYIVPNSWVPAGGGAVRWWTPEVARPNYNIVVRPVPAALKGGAFNDANSNHRQDAGEMGIATVAVTLAGSDGSSYTTQTAADGTYEFDNLTTGVTYTVSTSTPSGYTLEGYYADDGTPNSTASFTPSSTQPVGNIDAAFVTASTTTTLSSSNLSPYVGQAVTFTASVSPTGGGMGFPSGTVSFFDGNTLLASVTLSAGSQASFTTSSLSVGSHNISAVYGGDSTYAGSTSAALTETVQKAYAMEMLTTSNGSSAAGQPVTFTTTLYPPAGAGVPTGTISYYDNGVLLAVVTLGASGGNATCAFTTSGLSVGQHTITATYSGDANYSSSSSSLTESIF